MVPRAYRSVNANVQLPTRGRAVAIYEEALATATEDKWGAGFLDLSFLDIALGGTIVTPRRERGWG
jgi:hypothetical protein